MRRAARTDAPQVEIVTALRGYGCSVLHTHTIGHGCPDLVVGGPPGVDGRRRMGFLEVKTGSNPPSRRKLQPDQIKFWDEWAGCPLGLVTDVEGALRFARMLAFEAMP
jgi:hypothetical protein